MAHLHEVRDTDKHFVINHETMEITTESTKLKLMQGDHNSEIYTFEVPRTLESHDMTLCNRVEIHYNDISADKANSSKDFHTVTDMAVAEDDPDMLVFSWLIHGNATKYAGALSFRIKFGCVDENGEWTYKKHTDVYRGITISDGFDNTEAVAEEYKDAIATWVAELDEQEARIVALEKGGTGSKLTIGFVELLANKWVGNASPYSQIVTIPGVTAYSQVDLTPSVEQLAIFHDKDLAFVTENEDGVVTVYAIGDKPLNDYTMQVTIKEVSV